MKTAEILRRYSGQMLPELLHNFNILDRRIYIDLLESRVRRIARRRKRRRYLTKLRQARTDLAVLTLTR